MANRFWRGGSGTWNTSSTTNWSATSGGVGGASAPTSVDDVFFNVNSNIGTGTFTVTVSGTANCRSITVSGLDGAMTLNIGSGNTLNCFGSWSNQATLFSFAGTGAGTIAFRATTSGNTINTGSLTMTQNLEFNGTGGWNLASNITCANITLTAGTLNTTVTNYLISCSRFISTGSSTRTLTLNGSQISLTASTGSTYWDVVSTGFTLNAGTSTIKFIGFGAPVDPTIYTFNGGNLTYNKLWLFSNNQNNDHRITGINTFGTLEVNQNGSNLCRVYLSNNQTITTSLVVTSIAQANRRTFFLSDVIGTTRTITKSSATTVEYCDFMDINFSGGAVSGTSLGDCGGNTNITFDAPKTVWIFSTSSSITWATGNIFSNNNLGPASLIYYPLPQDTVLLSNGSATSTTLIIGNVNLPILSFGSRTNSITFSSSTNNPWFFGGVVFGTGLTISGSGDYVFINRSPQLINCSGISRTMPNVVVNSPGGGITLLAALSVSNKLSLINGTLNLSSYTLTTFTAQTGGTLLLSGTKNITFNGGTLAVTGNTATAFENSVPTGFTTTAGTGTGTISMTAATAKTFVGGGSTYNCTLNQGGAGTLTITGSNTFNNITNTTQPATVLFTAGTTNTFNDFSLSGTSGNLITIGSVTAASHTLSKASGTVSVSFCSISYSNATGGASWLAYTTNGNVNVSNNSGWKFAPFIPVSISETSNSVDSIGEVLTKLCDFNDSSLSSDLISSIEIYPRSLLENSSSTEAFDRLVIFSELIDETSNSFDVVSEVSILNVLEDEETTASDLQIVETGFARLISDQAAASSSLDNVLFAYRSVLETSNAEASVVGGPIAVQAILENAQISSATNFSFLSVTKSINESALADDFAATGNFIRGRSVANSARASSVVSEIRTSGQSVIESSRATGFFNRNYTVQFQVANSAAAIGAFQSRPKIQPVQINENLSIADLSSWAYYWTIVVDTQTANWQNVVDTQAPTWVAVQDTQTPSWQNVTDTQSPSWSDVGTNQTPNWQQIN